MHALDCSGIIKGYAKTKNKVPFKLSIDKFQIEEGELFSLIGLNGAGKTTLLKIIVDLMYLDEGNILLFGENHKNKECRANISYLPENVNLPPRSIVKEVLFDFLSLKLQNKNVKRSFDESIELFNLERYLNKKIYELSKGMFQNLVLAITLSVDKRLYILDEPFNGLDNVQKNNIIDLLKTIHHKSNSSILITTHIFQDIEKFIKKVAVINKGKLVAIESMQNVLSEFNNLENYFLKIIKD